MECCDGHEVASHVDHQTPPGKARRILDNRHRKLNVLRPRAAQLDQRCKPAQYAPLRRRVQANQTPGIHFEPVTFVIAQLRMRRRERGAIDAQRG